MKKIIIMLICIVTISAPALAKGTSGNLNTGIMEYKKGNYVGCMQTMENVISANPGSVLAHYYLAISYVRVGKIEEAKKEYNNVIKLSPSSEAAFFANLGLQNLNSAPGTTTEAGKPGPIPSSPNIVPPSQTPVGMQHTGKKEFMSNTVKDTLIEKNINSVINDVNQSGSVDSSKLKRIEDLSKQKSENITPSKEELAQAIQTLSQAGLNVNFNPYQNTNPAQSINPEMMQLTMMMSMMGNNNGMGNNMNSNSMNMLPLLMMAQNPENLKNMDPQLMQTMITGMMMPDMFSLNNNDNNN